MKLEICISSYRVAVSLAAALSLSGSLSLSPKERRAGTGKESIGRKRKGKK
jgi:hypothetical protein